MRQALASRTIEQDGAKPGAVPPPTPEEIADRFPQFEILECLGRGGMGVVYKARQKSLKRLVAIKILAPERANETRFADRFAREAELLAQLNHPHIVTIHDFGETGGLFYLVMEFVDGVNLRDLLRDGNLEAKQALAVVPPICDALQCAHDKGIVHRDIKPENLLLDREGRIKIADFGVAALMGAGGDVAGTPPYMAPEQNRASGAIDHRADIYALGAVLYEMLTGERTAKEAIAPSKKVEVDVRLDEIVLRTLENKPELRFQQVSEVKTLVETIAGTGSEASSSSPAGVGSSGSLSTADNPTGSRKRWAVAALAISLLILGVMWVQNAAMRNRQMAELNHALRAEQAANDRQTEAARAVPLEVVNSVTNPGISVGTAASSRLYQGTGDASKFSAQFVSAYRDGRTEFVKSMILKEALNPQNRDAAIALIVPHRPTKLASVSIEFNALQSGSSKHSFDHLPDGVTPRHILRAKFRPESGASEGGRDYTVNVEKYFPVVEKDGILYVGAFYSPTDPLFGEASERVVNDLDDHLGKEALVLKSGQSLTIPPETYASNRAMAEWISTNRVDLLADHAKNRWALMTQKLVLREIPDRRWDELQTKDIKDRLAERGTELEVLERSGYRYYLLNKESKPPLLFAFETGTGDQGVFEISEFTHKPRSVKLRYKLIQ